MGSAVSTKVQDFESNGKITKNRTDNSEELKTENHQGVITNGFKLQQKDKSKKENGNLQEKSKQTVSGISDSGEKCELQQRVKDLELEVAKAQSQILDYEDQIQSLQEELISAHQLIPQNDNNLDTESEITQLQNEITSLNSQITHLNVKFKRKVKTLKTQIAEAKQTSHIQRMEMVDEINQLKDENSTLTQKLADAANNGQPSSIANSPDSSAIGQRTTLVLELSAQVSEQCQTIRNLEELLAAKEVEIESLKSEMVSENNTSQVSNGVWASQVGHKTINGVSKNSDNSRKTQRKKNYKIGLCKDSKPLSYETCGLNTLDRTNSDSDSDWTNEVIVSKIHSAPVGLRAQPTF